MIHDPVLILMVLAALEVLVVALSLHEHSRSWFNFLPPVFWIYFLPMLAATAGVIDAKAPILAAVTANLLPMSLFLLLIVVDVKAIWRLGPVALMMFFIGSAGIIAGAVVSFALFRDIVGHEYWQGFAALSASWTGGSANMIAVKEALAVPEKVFAPMVIVDTVVPYLWMGTLIACAGLQPAFDRWNRSDRSVLDRLNVDVSEVPVSSARWTGGGTFAVILTAWVFSALGAHVAGKLPVIRDVISPYAWTIVTVSLLGLAFSLTPVRRLEQAHASRIGTWLLYFVLTAIGARAGITDAGAALILIAAGCVIIAVHLLFLLAGARLLRAPLFLVAAASQANVGGVASAPVVAAVYAPGLASVGLLLAIFGNIVGTYLGILCGQFCRLLS